MSRRLNVLQAEHRPVYTVWELTLACDHGCAHCGSRAGKAREGELSTDEALEVVQQLVAMGCEEVVLIGGEAYLHPGFLDILAALRAGGIKPSLTTGGHGIDDALALAMAARGLHVASVSVDGLEDAHNLMRQRKDSFAGAMAAIRSLRKAGVRVGVNTNLNRLNEAGLEALYEVLQAEGVTLWQLQLTAPLGRAADRPDMILQPWMLLELLPRIERLKTRAFAEGMRILPGNNLGYFGPEEALLRSPTPEAKDHFAGCQAGRFIMGIESDGAIKGCPSLQKHYIAGNLRDTSLRDIWKQKGVMSFARQRTRDDLWGFCRECPYADVCLGGCSFTAHSFFGKPGNNPYCHYRAIAHKKAGKRERLVLAKAAPGMPFDHARYEVIVESMDAPAPAPASVNGLVPLRRRSSVTQ